MTPEEKIKRGNDAAMVMNTEVFREAWASLDAALIQNWAATGPLDHENRERYYSQLTGLRAVKARLEKWMTEGRQALVEIERTKQRAAGKRSATT